jgi:uncharacterized protein YfbU (UPF0304 family)
MWKQKMIVKDMAYMFLRNILSWIVLYIHFSVHHVAFNTIFPAVDAYNRMVDLAILSLEWSENSSNSISHDFP